MTARPPSILPITDPQELLIFDGSEIVAPRHCINNIKSRSECAEHYRKASLKPDAFLMCPFGFTTKSLNYGGRTWFLSGVIAHPRFDHAKEREVAKLYPKSRCTRTTIDNTIRHAMDIQRARADAVAEGSKVLPQAFHELRKLNGAVLQHAERVLLDDKDNRNVLSIKAAAELMRNNFDILEALSNIEGMRSLPIDSTVNLFDLAFKMKRVYQEKATARSISISVEGVRAIIKGSQKSFPLVPAVLIENAIKYGQPNQTVMVDIYSESGRAFFAVTNHSAREIDPIRCFERGARFADDVEGGGFGLFLAKEIVLAHRGNIKCVYRDGQVKMILDFPLSAQI